jgi:hypothetical protein
MFPAHSRCPLGVVTVIFPVTAPVGTVAVTCMAELTANVVALTPPNVTFVVCVRPDPVMTTDAPTFGPGQDEGQFASGGAALPKTVGNCSSERQFRRIVCFGQAKVNENMKQSRQL